MTPLVGLLYRGATLAEPDDLAVGTGVIGRPVWGRTALLGNLELRLGLPGVEGPDAVRTQRWSRRLAELASGSPRFYSSSYAVDPVGTARTLLSWRDAIVEAGWNGQEIANGGERLGTLRDLEEGSGLPPGRSDRLRTVEGELRTRRVRVFDGLDLAEPRDLWPGRWRSVFALLEEGGTPIRTVEPTFSTSSTDTDLSRLQALLRDNRIGKPDQLTGDGSLIFLRAETSWELGHALAALLRTWSDPSTAIIRGGELRPLDFALTAHGLASQGVASTSPWRPVLQLLPLAVELAFEPRDPYRVLELLTLPVGPFAGLMGNRLASALAEAPGIGGRAWRAAKESLEKYVIERARQAAKTEGTDEAAAVANAQSDIAERFARLAAWVEDPGSDPVTGAPRASLLAVADRVRAWLKGHFISARSAPRHGVGDANFEQQTSLVGAALSQTQAFHEALSHDPRETLDIVAARQLVEDVASAGEAVVLERERSGRLDPVDGPAGIRCPRGTVVWWHCVGGTEWRPATQPWRRAELDALRAAGVLLVDPARRLGIETDSWRRAILAAGKRLILAVPRWSEGQQVEPHPIWDEIVARFRARPSDIERVTLDVQDTLEGRTTGHLGSLLKPIVRPVPILSLPDALPVWKLDGSSVTLASKHSASSVEALVGCPLHWVLGYRAGLRSQSLVSIPSDPILNGKLGHRLVEELHLAGVLRDPERVATEAGAYIDRLIQEEAAVLLRPGKTFERAQLKKQILRSVTTLSELLASSGLVVDSVEATCVARWGSRSLEGRLDLVLRDAGGDHIVLDLKWGANRYRDLLRLGNAVQLAIYAAVKRLVMGIPELPTAAYFSLSKGELLATDVSRFATGRAVDGPGLSDTWSRLERTVDEVERALARGEIPVTGVRKALPLLDAVNVPEPERGRYLDLGKEAACTYCRHPSLCGRAWEGFR